MRDPTVECHDCRWDRTDPEEMWPEPVDIPDEVFATREVDIDNIRMGDSADAPPEIQALTAILEPLDEWLQNMPNRSQAHNYPARSGGFGTPSNQ